MMLVDLDGVTTAEGDMGAGNAGEVSEDAIMADGAGWVWSGGVDLGTFVRPKVEGDQGTTKEVGMARKKLHSFVRLQ